jgi:hypothetical protein
MSRGAEKRVWYKVVLYARLLLTAFAGGGLPFTHHQEALLISFGCPGCSPTQAMCST